MVDWQLPQNVPHLPLGVCCDRKWILDGYSVFLLDCLSYKTLNDTVFTVSAGHRVRKTDVKPSGRQQTRDTCDISDSVIGFERGSDYL